MQGEQELPDRIKELGATQVRAMLQSGEMAAALIHPASLWLAAQDRESERRSAESISEQIEIARSAKDAAWDAAKSARVSATEARESNSIARKAHSSAKMANIIAAISASMAIGALIISLLPHHS